MTPHTFVAEIEGSLGAGETLSETDSLAALRCVQYTSKEELSTFLFLRTKQTKT